MINLVNKDHIFNEDSLKNVELVEYEKYDESSAYVEKETLRYFEMLQAHLKVENIIIDIDNAYRSLETQEEIMLKYVKKVGLEKALELCDLPGYSEHHTGTAIDIVIKKDGEWLTNKDDLLKEVKTFKKIHKDLKYFGFILRYPKGKEIITGHNYEPWHIRYVGDIANEIGSKTLEEFLELY